MRARSSSLDSGRGGLSAVYPAAMQGGNPRAALVSLAIAAITRHDVADYLATLLQIYIVLIFIRILMSWIPRMPYNRYLNAVLNFVRDVTDPYLNLFRRFLPMVRIGPGALDLSPIVATVVLIIVGRIIIGLVDGP